MCFATFFVGLSRLIFASDFRLKDGARSRSEPFLEPAWAAIREIIKGRKSYSRVGVAGQESDIIRNYSIYGCLFVHRDIGVGLKGGCLLIFLPTGLG